MNWELLYYKTYAGLQAEISRGFLGVLWWIVEPVIYMSVFYIVFAILFDRGGPGYVPFLLCGLTVWKWFASSILQGANSIKGNMGLIQRVRIPKMVLPCSIILANAFKFLIILALLLIFLLLTGSQLHITWLAIFPLLICQLLFTIAAASLLAAVIPFFPDLIVFVQNGIMLLLFLSGIFFDIKELSEKAQLYLYMNPIATLITGYRQAILDGVWPDWGSIGLVFIFSLLGCKLVARLLDHWDGQYAKLTF